MYESLKLPWSSHPSVPETTYRAAGLVKTKGTLYLLPPSESILRKTFNAPPRPRSRMSAGAVALCKHFERGGASSEHGEPHPFWTLPRGSNENKTRMAEQILELMLQDAKWRNVMLLHHGVAVYEVRNCQGFGMRWTLDLEECCDVSEKSQRIPQPGIQTFEESRHQIEIDSLVGSTEGDAHLNHTEVVRTGSEGTIKETSESQQNGIGWKIVRTTFRGFLEPIEGMHYELSTDYSGPGYESAA